MSDGHFEARKIGMRQNKEGVIISFVVQPDDFSSALAMVPIGARMMIGWAQIGDDEKPIAVLNTKPKLDPVAQMQSAGLDGVAGGSPAGVAKPKKAFSDYPLSQQCAMTCEDAGFQEFLHDRAGLADVDVAQYVRSYCGVKSRSEIKPDTAAARRWRELEKAYEQYETDQRHAGSIRR